MGIDFDTIKPGDKIKAGYGFGCAHLAIYTVARLTKTQIVCTNGVRFRRDTGRRVAGERTRGVGIEFIQEIIGGKG